MLFFGGSADEGGAQGGGPGFAGLDDGGVGLLVPLAAAALKGRQALPGFDADKFGHTGFGPNQDIGELPDVADDAAAGALLIDAQSGGAEVHHAVAVVGEEVLVHGDGGDVVAQDVVVGLD